MSIIGNKLRHLSENILPSNDLPTPPGLGTEEKKHPVKPNYKFLAVIGFNVIAVSTVAYLIGRSHTSKEDTLVIPSATTETVIEKSSVTEASDKTVAPTIKKEIALPPAEEKSISDEPNRVKTNEAHVTEEDLPFYAPEEEKQLAVDTKTTPQQRTSLPPTSTEYDLSILPSKQVHHTEEQGELLTKYRKALEVLSSNLITHSNSNLQQKYKKALDLINLGKKDQALVLLNDPNLVNATKGRSAITHATLLIENKDYAGAEFIARTALKEHTRYKFELHNLIGQSQFLQKKFAEAITTLTTVSPPVGEYPGFYSLLAQSYIEIGTPAAAISIYKNIISSHRLRSEWWLGLGIAFRAAHQPALAYDAFKKALDIGTTSPHAEVYLRQQLAEIENS